MDSGDLPMEPEHESRPEPPPVFVRGVTVAPSLPWDQARAAGLEARLNAPLPLADVAFKIQRIGAWRPGVSGRFAAVYVRQKDIREGLTVRPQLDGQTVVVQFTLAAQRARQVQRLAMIAGAAALGAFLLIVLVATIWTARMRNAGQLAELEQAVAVRTREAAGQARSAAQTQALDALGMRERRADRVLEDLAWAAQARDPAVNVEAFHWQEGLLAVEVRGEAAPFVANDRLVRRAPAPLRRGVWLWGVQPAGAAGDVRP